MNQSYYQISQQLIRNAKSRNYDLFNFDPQASQEHLNDKKFQDAFNLLKEKYHVIYKLFGEENFNIICYEYFLYNPGHSASLDKYGHTFAEFLGNLGELEDFHFLKWLAKLDWFWYERERGKNQIQLPKGTLSSWVNIFSDTDALDILIDESIMECVRIEKSGNQYQMITE